jgi:ABC-type maltose transport system permease subunit
MELQELKNAWAEYDKKLSENLKINEELLKRMNLDKSKNELKTPMRYEIAQIIIMFLLACPMIFYGVYMIDQPLFSVLSFLSAAIALTCMIFSIKRIKAFVKVDYYNASVLQIQKEITSLKIYVMKFRKAEMILSAILVFSVFPVLMKWVHGFDMFTSDHFLDPIIRLTVIFAIGTPLGMWLSKHFYNKKIENAQYYLNEIERFSKEEQNILQD